MNIQKIASDYGISVDEVRSRWLVLRVAKWRADFRLFCKEAVRIRSKEGDLIPLVFNSAQEIIYSAAEKQLQEDRWVRLMCLKGRRQGFSSFVAARGFWKASLWPRQRIYLLSHEQNSANILYDMVALILQHHPFPPTTGTENAKELEFRQQGSSYIVATAGQKAGGRGGAVSFFHGSECAYWPSADEHFGSSVQSVDEVRGVWGTLWSEPAIPLPFEKNIGTIEGWVKAPSEIWLETTSSGASGAFYHRYMDALKGIGRYHAVFAPWNLQPEYATEGDFTPRQESDEEGEMPESEYQTLYKFSDAQMLWRRDKIYELGSIGRFRHEFPSDIQEAFSAVDTDDVFIKPATILKARKRSISDPDAPLIIGIDPAGAGGDRFAAAYRRGDKCIKITHRSKMEHNEAVAWLSNMIDEDKPARMCIDRGSIGANIVSALRAIKPEYSEIVRGIDFGGKSWEKQANPNKSGPFNVRASIWGRLREWINENGCIPDDDDLASDLAGPKIIWRANNDWILESKSTMKARGVRSPDLGDALALTFSTREFFTNYTPPKATQGFSVGVDYRPANKVDANNSNPLSWMM